MKNILFITMLLGVGYSQCDANSDSILDILDVMVNVDCILNESCNEYADFNNDGVANVIDVILIVNIILYN